MSAKLLSRKIRSAIARKKMEKEAGRPPESGWVVYTAKFDKKLPETVYQIIRAPLNSV